MNRQKLIPDTSTGDLAPKSPWHPSDRFPLADPAKKEAVIEPSKKKRSLAMKALLTFILVAAIIGIGILLPIKLIPSASNMLANVFNFGSKDEAAENEADRVEFVEFNADKRRLASGEEVRLSWGGPVRQDGKYALNFPCVEGTGVTLVAADGTRYPIQCGEPFQFLSVDNTMTLAMTSEDQRLAVIPFAFAYIDAEGETSRLGDIEITVTSAAADDGNTIVVNDNAASTTAASSPAQEQAATGSRARTVFDSDYYGPGRASTGQPTGGQQTASASASASAATAQGMADLQGRIIAIGKLDKATGAFIPSNSFSTSDRVAVQFEVVNIGGAASGQWAFSASLPTHDSKVYQSALQASIAPYSGVIFTLGFDGIRAGTNQMMTIQIDPQGYVRESNEANNVGSIAWTVGGSSGSSGTGKADLKATLVDVGRMSGSTFRDERRIETGDDAAIRFKVENIGGKASGSWDFRVIFTNEDGDEQEYESRSQASLLPGGSAILTVLFRDVDEAGEYEFEVEIDPERDVDDGNRRNNDLSEEIEVEED